MISQKTALQIHEVIHEWAQFNGVPMSAVIDLLRAVGDIPGNSSFRNSLRMLIEKTSAEEPK